MLRIVFLLLLTGYVIADENERDDDDESLHLIAQINLGGVRGRIEFIQNEKSDPISIKMHLESEDGTDPNNMTITINKQPVDYTKKEKCNTQDTIVDLKDVLGGALFVNNVLEAVITDSRLQLRGKASIWGRSVLVSDGNSVGCATIQAVGREVRTWEARFMKGFGGSVFFRSLSVGKETITIIYSELFDIVSDFPKSSFHKWQIYTNDILESGGDRDSCNFLQILYDPDVRASSECSPEEPHKCAIGDLYGKHGKAHIGTRRKGSFTKIYVDPTLSLPSTEGRRKLYLVFFDVKHDDSIIACSEMRYIKPVQAQAWINSEGVNGTLAFSQQSPFDPTVLNIDIKNLKLQAKGYHVHKYPVPPKRTAEAKVCSETGGHYNPFEINIGGSPLPGTGSHDKYELGDLSGKHGYLADIDNGTFKFVDSNLPLFGVYSVVGRSIVIHYTSGERWVCATIRYQGKLRTGIAQFTYPVAGRIIFRQPEDDSMADTTVFVEYLLYNDGNKNDTDGHKWHVHVAAPGRDYFNWTARCVSAGGHYNPYEVNLNERGYRQCSGENALRCELGDLVGKHSTLSVVATKKNLLSTRRFFTDTHLPLTGSKSILDRSIVIHDDAAPDFRGNRMACTRIYRKFRHKAVVTEWRYNVNSDFDGYLDWMFTMIQDTEYDVTKVEMEFDDLETNSSGYHVHLFSVPRDVVFPCLHSEVAGHYNPFNIANQPKNQNGTADQYEVGDLSARWGYLDGFDDVEFFYNDTNLPLFGVHNVLGRSIVIHKNDKGKSRWACGSIKWGYSPSEARQVSAIASFHHPQGYAYGYVRFRQVIYKSGDRSDTIIEVNLRYPGERNINITHGHRWEVFVNPVSQDAVVASYMSRCTAGGYIWDPYFIQLADPLNGEFYRNECGPDVPYRCKVGDLTARLGPITIGRGRFVTSDSNLPLGPKDQIVGRSLVIFERNNNGSRMACATIEDDFDLFKYGVIQRPPNFQASDFINHIRKILGVPSWMVELDLQHMKFLHRGACVQFKIHFMGPIAHKLEQDFSRLMNLGKLRQPSLQIPGTIPDKKRPTRLGYTSCSSLEYEKKYNNKNYSGGEKVSVSWVLLLFIIIAWLK